MRRSRVLDERRSQGDSLLAILASSERRSTGHASPALLGERLAAWAGQELGSLISAFLFVLLFALPAHAVDRSVSPPTCPNMLTKCRPREAVDALSKAHAQLEGARRSLREAEAAAGRILTIGDAMPGKPEAYEFWRAEAQRLEMNRAYLKEVRARLAGAALAGPEDRRAAAGGEAEGKSLRLVLRLALVAPDVEQESRFWVEGLGMQRYADLPGGGALVAYGPPGLARGDEGAFFGIEIYPAVVADVAAATFGGAAGPATAPRLSFMQIATPVQFRPFKILDYGGEMLDEYGFYEVQSPAGVIVRAYVDDRRDPVELVAVAAGQGDGDLELMRERLERLGFAARGPYRQVSPVTQAYMPELPPGNMLYSGGNPKEAVQVLLLPSSPKGEKAPDGRDPLDASSYVVIKGSDSRTTFEMLPDRERPGTPISRTKHARLITFAPPAAAVAAAEAATAASARGDPGALLLELRRPELAERFSPHGAEEWESHSG